MEWSRIAVPLLLLSLAALWTYSATGSLAALTVGMALFYFVLLAPRFGILGQVRLPNRIPTWAYFVAPIVVFSIIMAYRVFVASSAGEPGRGLSLAGGGGFILLLAAALFLSLLFGTWFLLWSNIPAPRARWKKLAYWFCAEIFVLAFVTLVPASLVVSPDNVDTGQWAVVLSHGIASAALVGAALLPYSAAIRRWARGLGANQPSQT